MFLLLIFTSFWHVIRFFWPKTNYKITLNTINLFIVIAFFPSLFSPEGGPFFFEIKEQPCAPFKKIETKFHCVFFFFSRSISNSWIAPQYWLCEILQAFNMGPIKTANYETLLQKLKHDLINSTPPPMDKHLKKKNEPTTKSTPNFTS